MGFFFQLKDEKILCTLGNKQICLVISAVHQCQLSGPWDGAPQLTAHAVLSPPPHPRPALTSQLTDGNREQTLSKAHRWEGGRIRETHSIFFFEMICGWPSQTNDFAPDPRTMWFSLLLCDCYIKSKLCSWGINMWWSPEPDGWSQVCRERATDTAGIFTLPVLHTVIWGQSWTLRMQHTEGEASAGKHSAVLTVV